MTIDQDLVARRWAAADADAERVLCDERWFLDVPRAVRGRIAIALVALAVTVGWSSAVPRDVDQRARSVVAGGIVVVALVAFVWVVVVGYRRRLARGQAFPTVTSMLPAGERQAIARGAIGRGTMPGDRVRVVRAAALLRSDAHRIEQALWMAVLWAALALGASSEDLPLQPMYVVAAALTLVGVAVTWFDVARVRRYLRRTAAPRTGA